MDETISTIRVEIVASSDKARQEVGRTAKELSKLGKYSKQSIRVDAKDVDKARKKVGALTNILNSMKRIAFYRVIRSAIKAVGEAFSQGAENAYWYSKTIGDQTKYIADAYDRLSSGSFKMSNQLGAAWATLKAAITPILIQIINLVTAAANAITQLFAILGGHGTYLRAIDYSKDWAETTAGGAAAAKEWKNQLMGFDEINRLEEPADGGGGGGGGLPDYENMFEEAPVDGIFAKIRDKLLELKESLNFDPLIESWERLKQSVKGLADTIAQALGWVWDNIIAPLVTWLIESALPVVLNLIATVIDLANTILQILGPAIDWVWHNILEPVVSLIGDTLINALKALTGFLEDLNSLLNGKISFAEFISGLSDAEFAVGLLVTALGVGGLISVLSTLGETVLVTVFLAIGKVNTALTALAGNPTVLAIAAIAAIIYIAVQLYRHWDEIIAKLRDFQNTLRDALNDGKLNWLDFAAVAVQTIMAPINAIITLVNWIITAVNWIVNLVNAWNGARDSISMAQSMAASADYGYGVFASGGYPETGQLFLAREAGPELVGTMGGRTAVANNDQIVEGIKAGVFEAVTSAMAGNSGSDKAVHIYLDGREIATTTTKYQRQFARANG